MKRLVLGTGGSELARAQTALVINALRAWQPDLEVAIEIIKTSGDEKRTEPQGRKGLFTGEIERALLERKIDVAVHSAKDLPSCLTSGLQIAATLPRENVEDVLVAKTSESLAAVAKGATIATGSVRRQHQLHWQRPDLNLADLRGNVPTRLRKLEENSWEGIILAFAGLNRLGPQSSRWHLSILPNEQFVPAGGQGVIALQIRSDDTDVRKIVARFDHEPTHLCLRAEREFLRLLQGDCNTPVGVLAEIENGVMEMSAQIFSDARIEPRAASIREELSVSPEALAASLVNKLSKR